MVFSQDFEREADYVGLYILTLGGRPIDQAANVWRLMGASNPGEIKFASSHPTTAERFVRLDTWRSEIGNKVAMGRPLQPEMKNGETFLMDGPSVREVAAAIKAAPGSTISTLAAAPGSTDHSSRHGSPAGADELAAPVETQQIKRETPPSKREDVPPIANRADRGAQAIIGAPTSEAARLSAPDKFAEAQSYLGAHKWQQAESAFRETLLLDGSVPEYHAALGKLLMQLRRYDEAEAEFTAATLLDLDNPVYRKLVKEARSKR
jgi:predicted Zn-dependent protease